MDPLAPADGRAGRRDAPRPVGLVAGWLIGKWTEYSTSNEFAPTKELADQALTGPATIIIGGVAEG
ncbi:MAG: sodium/proton-translocating pyrophosphatase, partial [Vulcanococcus sp.]